MAIKQDVSALLETEVSRRDFLKRMGVGVVAMTGAASIIKAMTSMNGQSGRTVTVAANAYGAGAYGGVRKS